MSTDDKITSTGNVNIVLLTFSNSPDYSLEFVQFLESAFDYIHIYIESCDQLLTN